MKSIYKFESISEVLAIEYDRRKTRNVSYSLRAFARDLEMSVSRLSEVMSGSHGLSEKSANQIARQLKMSPIQKQYWLDMILAKSARNPNVKNLAKNRLSAAKKNQLLQEIKDEQFQVISEWYHLAIMEMTQLYDFSSDPRWIANYLGLDLEIVMNAIARLKKLNLLKTDGKGNLMAHPEAYQTFSKTSGAIRKFHQFIQERNSESIAKDEADLRHCQAMIVAIPKGELPRFAAKMRNFLQDFWNDLDESPKDELYAMSVQMVPLCPQRSQKHERSKGKV